MMEPNDTERLIPSNGRGALLSSRDLGLEPNQVIFLIDLLNMKGLAFPIDRARIAVETLDRLVEMQKQSG